MKINFQNILTSSFLLFLDNLILKKGEAHSPVSSNFYPISGVYDGYYTYAAPYKQIVNDVSISGIQQLSGVYLNNTFIVPGQSGLVAINHQDGQVIFNSNKNAYTISGNYSIKDFNVYLTDKSEETILFTTKIENKNRKPQTLRGLESDEITYPAVFVRLDNSMNDPFAFGGTDMTKVELRTIIMANSMFSLDAVCGILRDSAHDFFHLIKNSDLNMNAMSAYTGSSYNYSGISTGEAIYVADVGILRLKAISSADFVNLNPKVFSAFADFQLESIRNPHSD